MGRGGGSVHCYFIDGSQAGTLLARATSWIVNTRVRKLVYRMNDVNVESGFHLFFRTNQDLLQVQQLAMKQQTFQDAVRGSLDRPRLPTFLIKKLVGGGPVAQPSFLRALLLIYVCAWETRRNHPASALSLLFLELVPWLDAVSPFAQDQGVSIVPIRRSARAGTLLRRLLPGELKNILRLLRYRRFRGTKALLSRKWFEKPDLPDASPEIDASVANSGTASNGNYRIAAEYVGLLNLSYPERNSNLFFLDTSSLEGKDLMVTFTASNVPLDEPTQAELNEHGVTAVITHHGATTLDSASVFSGPRSLGRDDGPKPNVGRRGFESNWIKRQLSEYREIRDYWAALFKAHDVRIYVNYNKIEAAYFARADAMESLGGITVNYERTHNSYARLDLAGNADVMFN